jgi:DNA-binding NarL/FixJ family response regulator
LGASTITILVVEDSRPFRSFITSFLREQPGWGLVGEVSDGVAAVVAAQTLRPTLVLMDIGLPTLNGLEAARQIRQIVPTTKVVFLTQETDSDVAKEAFNVGACGYVLKQQAGTELLPALAAALQGERFVSRGVFNGLNPTK